LRDASRLERRRQFVEYVVEKYVVESGADRGGVDVDQRRSRARDDRAQRDVPGDPCPCRRTDLNRDKGKGRLNVDPSRPAAATTSRSSRH
jgi:hypothetical protein